LVFYNAKSKGKYNKGNGIVASGEGKDIKENGIMVSVGFKNKVCKLNVMLILMLTKNYNAHNT
jgi:hypothetical protein